MKSSISSNGNEVQIILEPENPLEVAIVSAMNTYSKDAKVTTDENRTIVINITTKP